MFGYVRARRDTLSAEGLADHDAVYCGLCHAMGRRGAFSRMFLNYDFTLLAMLLAPVEATCDVTCRKCLPHPIQGRPACAATPWLETAADESIILTVWKLRDTVADGGLLARLGARLLLLGLRPAYRGAKAACPGFDAQVSRLLSQLRVLEEDNCPSLDRTADCFARLLSAAAPETGDAAHDRALGQLLYHLGRWIYLIDAVDDLPGDKKTGSYNPVALRFPAWTQEDKTYLRQSLDGSLELAGAAFQLLDRNKWSPVVENILYSGLPGVEELVFSGQWRDYQKRHRRSTHE